MTTLTETDADYAMSGGEAADVLPVKVMKDVDVEDDALRPATAPVASPDVPLNTDAVTSRKTRWSFSSSATMRVRVSFSLQVT